MKLYQNLTMVTMGVALSLSSVFIQVKQVKAADFTFTQSGYTLTTFSPGGASNSIPPAGFPSPSNPFEIVGSFTTSGTTITDASLNILDDVVNFDQRVIPPVNLIISKGGSFDPSTNSLSLSVSAFPSSGIIGSGAVFGNTITSNGGQFDVDFYRVGESINGFSGSLRGVSSQPAIVREVPEPDWMAADALLLVLGTFSLRSYVGKKVGKTTGYESNLEA